MYYMYSINFIAAKAQDLAIKAARVINPQLDQELTKLTNYAQPFPCYWGEHERTPNGAANTFAVNLYTIFIRMVRPSFRKLY